MPRLPLSLAPSWTEHAGKAFTTATGNREAQPGTQGGRHRLGLGRLRTVHASAGVRPDWGDGQRGGRRPLPGSGEVGSRQRVAEQLLSAPLAMPKSFDHRRAGRRSRSVPNAGSEMTLFRKLIERRAAADEVSAVSERDNLGTRRDDREPERLPNPDGQPRPAAAGEVTLVREERQQRMGATLIYRIYKGPDGASALAFLAQTPVSEPRHYLVVETPEGNYCRDSDGIYKE